MNYYRNVFNNDKTIRFLLIFGLVLSISKGTRVLGLALIIYAIGRRGTYINIKSEIEQTIRRIKNKLGERKNFLITRCPNCSQKVRLPRRKGNILVTCPRCGYKFKLKT